MSRHERFYRIDQLLNQHGVVSFETLQAALEVSRATLKRDLQFLRDRFHAPIVTTGTRAATVSSVAASRPALRAAGPVVLGEGDSCAADHAPVLPTSIPAGCSARTSNPVVAARRAAGQRERCERADSAAHPPADRRRSRVPARRLRARRLGLAAAQTPGDRLSRPWHRRADAAYRLAPAPGALPAQLVSRCLVPQARRSAGFAVDAIRRAEIAEQPCIDVDEAELDAALGRTTASSRPAASVGPRCASAPSRRAGLPPSAGTRSSAARSLPTAATSSSCPMQSIPNSSWISCAMASIARWSAARASCAGQGSPRKRTGPLS